MIIRIISGGKSFKGLAAYLTHDPNAETEERVGWTHTLNLANDHVPSAVSEMVWTARDAELLKQEAGIRAGGRATENTVKHVSLNWAPGEEPTREHMIETADGFLRSMGWQEQQTVIVNHTDKAFSHVHLMIGTVHPETGLKLNDAFEQRRAQTWALEYEREQGRIHCEQRLKDVRDRQDAPTRDAWTAFAENQKMFERAEAQRRQQAENRENAGRAHAEFPSDAWAGFKNQQRAEREAFFATGKTEFSDLRLSIYREVREDFRERWAELYAARRAGADADTLAAGRLSLIAEQKDSLTERRDAACEELRASRDSAYRDLLDQQRDMRAGFKDGLSTGRDPAELLRELHPEPNADTHDPRIGFREAAAETTVRDPRRSERAATADPSPAPKESGSERREDERPVSGGSAGLGIFGLGLLNLGESLFATFLADDRPRQTREEKETDLFAAAADAAAKRLHDERQEADEEWRERQKATARD